MTHDSYNIDHSGCNPVLYTPTEASRNAIYKCSTYIVPFHYVAYNYSAASANMSNNTNTNVESWSINTLNSIHECSVSALSYSKVM